MPETTPTAAATAAAATAATVATVATIATAGGAAAGTATAATAADAGRPGASRVRLPPPRLVVGPHGHMGTWAYERTYRYEVHMPRKSTGKKRKQADVEYKPELEHKYEPDSPACIVCQHELDKCDLALGCPKCTCTICGDCWSQQQLHNLARNQQMNSCPGCRQAPTRMVEHSKCFNTTGTEYKKQKGSVPLSCNLCSVSLTASHDAKSCSGSKCHFTACKDCLCKIQDINDVKKKERDLCPSCGVGHVPGREACCLCVRALGNSGELDMICPKCNTGVHLYCWNKQKLANVIDGLPENQCPCCGMEVEMMDYAT